VMLVSVFAHAFDGFFPQSVLALRGLADGLRHRWRVPVPDESPVGTVR
jgi:hypothetical protein